MKEKNIHIPVIYVEKLFQVPATSDNILQGKILSLFYLEYILIFLHRKKKKEIFTYFLLLFAVFIMVSEDLNAKFVQKLSNIRKA